MAAFKRLVRHNTVYLRLVKFRIFFLDTQIPLKLSSSSAFIVLLNTASGLFAYFPSHIDAD